MSKDWNYKSGDWWVICDICGKKVKASDSKHRWDGYVVCKDDYENRHPQDFIRAKMDRIQVPFTRPRPTDTFAPACNGTTAIAGIAQAGCMVAGNSLNNLTPIPSSTFNGTTL